MFCGLKRFLEVLAGDTAKLRKSVSQTLQRVEEMRSKGEKVETLDTLARLLHEGKAGGDGMRERDRWVQDAKVSVAAWFRHLETEALRRSLPGYAQLLCRLFGPDPGIGHQKATRDSSYRVLTFNYDRLFEYAFRRHFTKFDCTDHLYGSSVLNSGLSSISPEVLNVDLNRFCFLKLHGSVGLYGISSETDPSNKQSKVEHEHAIPDPGDVRPVTEEEFFFPDDPASVRVSGGPRPVLITFPHEKEHPQQYPDNLLPYRNYVPEIWDAAHHFVGEAEEIQIIGYSCPDADADPQVRRSLRTLFAAAKDCRRYVIEEPSPGGTCQRLWTQLPREFSGEVVCRAVKFGSNDELIR